MSDKKADLPRYWVTYLLEDLEVGNTFRPDLLHLTIIPWFVTDQEEAEVIKSFYKYFSDERTFKVTIGPVREFKHKRRISVNPIQPTAEILKLHQKALNWFTKLEARWAVENSHVGQDYVPHIRRRQGYNQLDGDKLLIQSLSLVKASRRGDDVRTVVAKVKLNDKN